MSQSPELSERLEAACPNGIDIYFENVGGPVLDAVFAFVERLCAYPGVRADRALQRQGVSRI